MRPALSTPLGRASRAHEWGLLICARPFQFFKRFQQVSAAPFNLLSSRALPPATWSAFPHSARSFFLPEVDPDHFAHLGLRSCNSVPDSSDDVMEYGPWYAKSQYMRRKK
jgi:hypothetical protein